MLISVKFLFIKIKEEPMGKYFKLLIVWCVIFAFIPFGNFAHANTNGVDDVANHQGEKLVKSSC